LISNSSGEPARPDRIRPGLRWLLAANPSPMTLDGTRTYVVGSRAPAIIDPGPAMAAHVDALLQLLDGAAPVAIVLTHGHADHSAAAMDLARRTGAPVWMAAGATGDSPPLPRIDHVAREGDTIRTDAGELRTILTPGHAPEHLCVLWPSDRAAVPAAAFVGDLFMGQGFTTLITPPDGDLGAYLASLDRVEALDLDVLLPAHGEPLLPARAVIARFREHRLERLAQVRRALIDVPATDLDGIVDRVYAGLDPRLREAAKGSVLAMLEYLCLTD
jgi:glyoxylase-like metal-dependent hydrolase (beta-lactamase superfamily II)